jgi:uncharacterized protein (DUF2062 family)
MFEKIKSYIEKQNYMEKYNISKRYFAVNKKMVSRAVFIGLFIAMIPMPAQMLAVFAFTFVGKFNFPIAIAMCWITNPLTMPAIYYIQYMTGSYILGIEPTSVELTIEWFNNNFTNIMIPLYFGAFLYSIVLSTFSYYAINLYWGNKKIRIR